MFVFKFETDKESSLSPVKYMEVRVGEDDKSVKEMCEIFESFLRGCGYQFIGNITEVYFPTEDEQDNEDQEDIFND